MHSNPGDRGPLRGDVIERTVDEKDVTLQMMLCRRRRDQGFERCASWKKAKEEPVRRDRYREGMNRIGELLMQLICKV